MAGMAVGRETSVESSPASRGRSSPRRETSSIMRRLFVASMFSLSVAGCAQSRSALTDGTSPKAPVAITPVPSPYDNINTGVGGPASARMAIKDPDSPQWYGRAQPAGTTTAGQVAGTGPSQATAPLPAANRGLPAPAPLAAEMPQTANPSIGVNPSASSDPPLPAPRRAARPRWPTGRTAAIGGSGLGVLPRIRRQALLLTPLVRPTDRGQGRCWPSERHSARFRLHRGQTSRTRLRLRSQVPGSQSCRHQPPFLPLRHRNKREIHYSAQIPI